MQSWEALVRMIFSFLRSFGHSWVGCWACTKWVHQYCHHSISMTLLSPGLHTLQCFSVLQYSMTKTKVTWRRIIIESECVWSCWLLSCPIPHLDRVVLFIVLVDFSVSIVHFCEEKPQYMYQLDTNSHMFPIWPCTSRLLCCAASMIAIKLGNEWLLWCNKHNRWWWWWLRENPFCCRLCHWWCALWSWPVDNFFWILYLLHTVVDSCSLHLESSGKDRDSIGDFLPSLTM